MSDEATYTAHDQRVVLTGTPRLILYPKEDEAAGVTANPLRASVKPEEHE